MGAFRTTITPHKLIEKIGTADCPVILDVRRRAAFEESDDIIPTALWRAHKAPTRRASISRRRRRGCSRCRSTFRRCTTMIWR